jgi:hypothetical protein
MARTSPEDDFRGGQLFATIDSQKMMEDFVAAALWLIASSVHGQNRGHRILLRRQRRQCAGGAARTGPGRLGPILWRVAFDG